MKAICILRSDDCTYSFEETLFVTNDELSADVHNRLKRDFIINEEQLFKLTCDKELHTKDVKGYKVTLTITDVEVV